MQVDRILIDILDWLRRSLYWRRARSVKKAPFEVLRTERADRGMLKLVERDTPRAVRTWVFTAYPRSIEGFTSRGDLRDIHICLDHLYPLAGEGGRRYPQRWSHRVSILSASRYLSEDGSYETSTIFQRPYDLVGGRPEISRDRWAIAITDQLANLVGKFGLQLEWHLEIELERKRFLGGAYKPSEFE